MAVGKARYQVYGVFVLANQCWHVGRLARWILPQRHHSYPLRYKLIGLVRSGQALWKCTSQHPKLSSPFQSGALGTKFMTSCVNEDGSTALVFPYRTYKLQLVHKSKLPSRRFPLPRFCALYCHECSTSSWGSSSNHVNNHLDLNWLYVSYVSDPNDDKKVLNDKQLLPYTFLEKSLNLIQELDVLLYLIYIGYNVPFLSFQLSFTRAPRFSSRLQAPETLNRRQSLLWELRIYIS